jgi:hypothetical protein
LVCFLLSACETKPSSGTSSGDLSGAAAGNAVVAYPIDRHPGLSAPDGSPSASHMMGDKGILSYNDGCLYMARDGIRIGLVAPANAKFDGETFTIRNVPYHLGQSVDFDGLMASETEITKLNCKDAIRVVIIAP